MTKVKTILREFCSAKDILAINRLGLLSKGEERESQPVPWRHRLHRKERKELVRSEMRMSLRSGGRLSSRDKAKAVTEARSPHTSRMGDYLIQQHVVNTRTGGPGGGEVCRLTGEQKRSEQQLHLNKRGFLRTSHCLNREPLILVERPPSPKAKTRARIMEKHGVDPVSISLPSYMRPLRTKSRTPSTLTTIEAYTLQTKKKKNVWEEVAEDPHSLRFKSMAKPSAPLTAGEKKQLRMGYTLHKPTPESIQEKAASRHKVTGSSSRPRSSPGEVRSSTPVFITEYSPASASYPGTKEDRHDEVVSRSMTKSAGAAAAAGHHGGEKSQSFPFAKSHLRRTEITPPLDSPGRPSRKGKKHVHLARIKVRDGAVSADSGSRGVIGVKPVGGSPRPHSYTSRDKQPAKVEATKADRSRSSSSAGKTGKKTKDFLSVILDE